MLNNVALIVAGGSSTRFDDEIPKQYQKLTNGKTIINHVISKFAAHVDMTCVVINKQHPRFFDYSGEYVHGGETRQESVRLGLKFLKRYSPQRVLIHDAARPFVSVDLIQAVLAKLNNCEAVDIALPITDTLKTYDGKILPRENIYATQTPQGFHFDIITDLHSIAYNKGKHYTDDISLYLESGRKNLGLVQGSPENIKITYKSDLLCKKY